MPDGLPFSRFEVRDDSNPSGDGLSHLKRTKLGGAATPFALPKAYDGPRLPTPSPSLARLRVFPVQPEAGTWKARELVKQKINELPDKKEDYKDGRTRD